MPSVRRAFANHTTPSVMQPPVSYVEAGTRRRQSMAAGANTIGSRLSALQLKAIWTAFLQQSPAFWFTSFYLFLEYVRPQQIYTSIAFIPWGKIAIVSAVVFSVLEGRIAFREKFLWAGVAAFTAVLVLSSLTAYSPSAALKAIDVWGIWLLCISVVAGSIRSRTEVILTFFLWCLWNFKMSQSAFRSWMADGFQFREWGASGAPGWFSNSGEFGIEMCVFFPIASYLLVALWPSLSKTRKAILAIVALSAVIGAVGSSSRGAVLGLGAIGVWILLRSRQRVKAGIVVILLSGIVWVFLPAESKKRWSEAGDDKTSTLRLQYWKDGIKIAEEHPLLGIGYKNWMPYYTARYNPNGQLPHNIFIECVAELGFTGLIIFLMLIGGTFWQNAVTRRHTGKNARAPDRLVYFLTFGLDGALVGYLASGFFVTVLYYPYFWVNLAFTMALARYTVSRTQVSAGAARAMRRNGGAPLPSGA